MDLEGPRQLIKVIYPPEEILLLAVLAGAQTFTAIAQLGRDKRDLLRGLRPVANGTPDHDRRVETRRTTVFHDVGWLAQRHDWPGLKGVVMVESGRRTGKKTERETRFYITSSADAADRLAEVVCRHWSVESMRWLMDCVLRA